MEVVETALNLLVYWHLARTFYLFMEVLETQSFKAAKWLFAKAAYSTDMLTACCWKYEEKCAESQDKVSKKLN